MNSPFKASLTFTSGVSSIGVVGCVSAISLIVGAVFVLLGGCKCVFRFEF
jgi:hypothetical protein